MCRLSGGRVWGTGCFTDVLLTVCSGRRQLGMQSRRSGNQPNHNPPRSLHDSKRNVYMSSHRVMSCHRNALLGSTSGRYSNILPEALTRHAARQDPQRFRTTTVLYSSYHHHDNRAQNVQSSYCLILSRSEEEMFDLQKSAGRLSEETLLSLWRKQRRSINTQNLLEYNQ